MVSSDDFHNKSSNEKSEVIKISKLTNFPEKVITSLDLKNQ